MAPAGAAADKLRHRAEAADSRQQPADRQGHTRRQHIPRRRRKSADPRPSADRSTRHRRRPTTSRRGHCGRRDASGHPPRRGARDKRARRNCATASGHEQIAVLADPLVLPRGLVPGRDLDVPPGRRDASVHSFVAHCAADPSVPPPAPTGPAPRQSKPGEQGWRNAWKYA